MAIIKTYKMLGSRLLSNKKTKIAVSITTDHKSARYIPNVINKYKWLNQ